MAERQDRRQFLKSSGMVLSCMVGGAVLSVSPRAALAAGLPYHVLTDEEVSTLQALAEAIVPSAREAGISHFIDKQLGADKEDSLLMLKYLGVPASDFTGFYQSGLRSAARLAKARFGKPWPALSTGQADQLLAEMNSGAELDWNGPPPGFFFFVLRADACDVVYGTGDGFRRVGMPYMAHIEPAEVW